MARRFSPTTADAEDAVQDVFVAVWQAARRFDADKGDEATFVTMIARRRLIDRLRQQPDAEFVDVVDDLPGTNAAEAEGSADVRAVSQAIKQLESPQREALLLSVYAGFSHAAIAQRLELPLGTVKTHVRRGMQKVRDQLGISAGESAGGAKV